MGKYEEGKTRLSAGTKKTEPFSWGPNQREPGTANPQIKKKKKGGGRKKKESEEKLVKREDRDLRLTKRGGKEAFAYQTSTDREVKKRPQRPRDHHRTGN